jgi:hypothetical protein
MEARIQQERMFFCLLHRGQVFLLHLANRYAIEPYPSSSTPKSLFPSTRSDAACHPLRETTSIHRPLFPSHNVIFANLLHGSLLRTRRGAILRLSDWMPQSCLYGRLRNYSLSPERSRDGIFAPDQNQEGQETGKSQRHVQLDRMRCFFWRGTIGSDEHQWQF